EPGDDLAIGQRGHEIGLDAGAGMGANAGAVFLEPGRGGSLFVQLVDSVALGKRLFAGGQKRAGLENFDGHGKASPSGGKGLVMIVETAVASPLPGKATAIGLGYRAKRRWSAPTAGWR